jgi:RimJ/RimL family protein N-acetyltransferase
MDDMTIDDLWPVRRVVVRSPRMVLRVPDEADLAAAARVAARGIYDPQNRFIPRSPVGGWSDLPSPEAERAFLQYAWATFADWRAERWNLLMVAVVDEEVIGVQEIGAKDVAVSCTVSTGSWIGRDRQRQGWGKEMRRAALHLAFNGLGMDFAESAAWEQNEASLGVSRAMGYRENGITIRAFDGKRQRQVNLLLPREAFAQFTDDLEIVGLEPDVLAMMGLSTS